MTSTIRSERLGADVTEAGVRFRLWAPAHERVELLLDDRALPLERDADGYHALFVPGLAAGTRYRFRLGGDGADAFPDPASRFQPEGVHGPSEVVDLGRYAWRCSRWAGRPLAELVIYELHVGTFTPEGTFAAASERLEALAELGITALELMPLHDFPGDRNWGYDPAALSAPARVYGRPEELQALVDRAHELGMAVLLDVVYNHLGPDGAYLPLYSPFVFSERHETVWGKALNFDGEGAHGMRRLLLQNALDWLRDYRFDGLRLDATFAIEDDSDPHFLAELSARAAELPGPRRWLIAEDNRNERALLLPRDRGGYGLDGVWADDFHHQLRSALAGDDLDYYRDYSGSSADLATTINENWFYTGQHSEHAGAPRGTEAADQDPERFVYCLDNHDQVGNRAGGERLSHDVSPAGYRAASALLLLLPQLPLLFMGQEWAASTPFLYFTDHHDELGRLVSEGRKREFRGFGFHEVPDPQDPATFERSRLRWEERREGAHARTLTLYRDLLRVRPQLRGRARAQAPAPHALRIERGAHTLLLALRPGVELPRPAGEPLWSSEAPRYADPCEPPEIDETTVAFPVEGALLFGPAGSLETPGPGERDEHDDLAHHPPGSGGGR